MGNRKILLTVLLLLPVLAVLPLTAPAANIVYNLYATDTYVKLADGTQLYNYGFVGGRVGESLTFQNSWVQARGASAVPGGTTTIPTGSPTPTGGLMTATETPLFGNAQFPAPVIYCAMGDVVEIRLKNLGVSNRIAPNDPHTIHLHGLDVDVANDGVPETSVAAVPANLAVPGAGNVVVYMFSPKAPGTYMYHCHQEADIHVQMGMYGALVVYNPADGAYASGGPTTGGGNLWGWNYDKDVIMLLSEVDINQHISEAQALPGAATYNPVDYHPQYWMINGLSFPNTVHHDVPLVFIWTDWIAGHKGYDPLILGSIGSHGGTGDKVLIRVINMGYEAQPMHMHGYHAKILGSDQRQWSWAQPAGVNVFNGTGLEKQTLLIGSGETYEWLLDFGQQKLTSTYANGNGNTPTYLGGTFPGGTQTRYTAAGPVSNTSIVNPAIPVPGTAVKGAPPFTYVPGPIVTDLWGPTSALGPGQPMVGSQVFVFHNHDDYKATNNGVYPGGMFTAIVPLP